MSRTGGLLAGSMVSGVLASACCAGPLLLTVLGVSGGAIAHRFEPFRPYFLVVTYGLLAGAFYLTYRGRASACAPGDGCSTSRPSRFARAMLWISVVVVAFATAFPWYAERIFG